MGRILQTALTHSKRRRLYLNDGALTAKQVKSIMLVAADNPVFWKDSFKLELLTLELPAQPPSQPILPAP